MRFLSRGLIMKEPWGLVTDLMQKRMAGPLPATDARSGTQGISGLSGARTEAC